MYVEEVFGDALCSDSERKAIISFPTNVCSKVTILGVDAYFMYKVEKTEDL